jgi:hypothetical protein
MTQDQLTSEDARCVPSKLSEAYPDLIGIVGTGRSGTTYLWRVLSSIGGTRSSEVKFIVPYYKRFGQPGLLQDSQRLHELLNLIDQSTVFTHTRDVRHIPVGIGELECRIPATPTYTQIIYATLELLAEKITPEADRLVYKHPPDVLHMPLIAGILPTVRFIHIIRDVRPVAISMEKQEEWGPTNLYSAARHWARVVAKGRQDGQLLGDRYLEIRYEDLFLKTEETALKLTRYVTQADDAAGEMIDFIRETGNVDRVQAWQKRLDVEQRRICEAAAGEVMRHVGYSTEFGGNATISPVSAAYYLASDFLRRGARRFARRLSHFA